MFLLTRDPSSLSPSYLYSPSIYSTLFSFFFPRNSIFYNTDLLCQSWIMPYAYPHILWLLLVAPFLKRLEIYHINHICCLGWWVGWVWRVAAWEFSLFYCIRMTWTSTGQWKLCDMEWGKDVERNVGWTHVMDPVISMWTKERERERERERRLG